MVVLKGLIHKQCNQMYSRSLYTLKLNFMKRDRQLQNYRLCQKPDTNAEHKLSLKTQKQNMREMSASVLVKQELCKSSLQRDRQHISSHGP